jgi:hypothetical protein
MTARTGRDSVARDSVSSNSRPRVAGARRARGRDFNFQSSVGDFSSPDDGAAVVMPRDGAARAVGSRQEQLALGQDRVRDRGERPTESARKAGLVGIAQAREALAEAVRRAKSRAEAKAA